MPGLIGISEFVDETMDDYNSPTTSTFVAKMPQCRQTVSGLEDVSLFVVCIVIGERPYLLICRQKFMDAQFTIIWDCVIFFFF